MLGLPMRMAGRLFHVRGPTTAKTSVTERDVEAAANGKVIRFEDHWVDDSQKILCLWSVLVPAVIYIAQSCLHQFYDVICLNKIVILC